MAFRFWRRVKIAPGVTLNLSKSGGSLSFGPRGAKLTIGPGGQRVTAGLPGTGLFYTTTFPSGKTGRTRSRASRSSRASPEQPDDRLTMGFFKRLFTPDDEEALVNGLREFVAGNEDAALGHLRDAAHIPDGAFLAGFLCLRKELLDDADKYLSTAAKHHSGLGQYFSKYGIAAALGIPITEELSAHVEPDLRGVLLGLVEVYQLQGRWKDAITCLERLRKLEPDDVVVRLSLAELLIESGAENKNFCRKVVELAEGVQNESPVHAALLLYKGKALRRLGLLDAARETLTDALKKTKERSADLLNGLRYERALVYEGLGQSRRARSELEKLFADAPDYEDVATRLGIA
jgi:tetratricopeptide (TPR) repeat protein